MAGAERSSAAVRAWDLFCRGVHGLGAVLAVVAAIGVVVLALMTVADVAKREVTDRSINGVPEIGALLLTAVVVLGLSHSEFTKQHVRTRFFTSHLRPRVRVTVMNIACLPVIGVVIWMVVTTFNRALDSIERGEETLGLVAVPVWPVRLMIPIALALLALELIIDLVDRIRHWKNPPSLLEADPGVHAEAPEGTDAI